MGFMLMGCGSMALVNVWSGMVFSDSVNRQNIPLSSVSLNVLSQNRSTTDLLEMLELNESFAHICLEVVNVLNY